jgi:hypothetical protein
MREKPGFPAHCRGGKSGRKACAFWQEVQERTKRDRRVRSDKGPKSDIDSITTRPLRWQGS